MNTTKFALSLILSLFAFSSIAVAKVDSGPHPPAKVNWLNAMGCDQTNDICINIDYDDNEIEFVLRVRFSKMIFDLTTYPQMMFDYDIGDGQVVGTTALAEDQVITPINMYDGTPANEVAYSISISVGDLCDDPFDTNFNYTIGYQLVTTGSAPYPVGAHPSLFPTGVYSIDSPSDVTAWEDITKKVCCTEALHCDPEEPPSIKNRGNTSNSNAETSEENSEEYENSALNDAFKVYPNPFQNTIQIDYNTADAGEVSIVCLDPNGKQVAQQLRQHDSKGDFNCSFSTDNWPAGVYFIRLLNGDNVQTLKIMKM